MTATVGDGDGLVFRVVDTVAEKGEVATQGVVGKNFGEDGRKATGGVHTGTTAVDKFQFHGFGKHMGVERNY